MPGRGRSAVDPVEIPARLPYAHRLGEEIVVQHARVHGEYPHEQDDISAAKR